jgi:hypothetical protein
MVLFVEGSEEKDAQQTGADDGEQRPLIRRSPCPTHLMRSVMLRWSAVSQEQTLGR